MPGQLSTSVLYHMYRVASATTCLQTQKILAPFGADTADFQACTEEETVSQIVRQRMLAATAALTLVRDIYCGPEVLFQNCVAIKFVDDDDDDDLGKKIPKKLRNVQSLYDAV